MSKGTEAKLSESTWYDYDVQAWVEQGRYANCGHPEGMNCQCYGREHEGDEAQNPEEARRLTDRWLRCLDGELGLRPRRVFA